MMKSSRLLIFFNYKGMFIILEINKLYIVTINNFRKKIISIIWCNNSIEERRKIYFLLNAILLSSE